MQHCKKQVTLFLNENKAHDFFYPGSPGGGPLPPPPPKDIPSTNPSIPRVTTTPPHPKYQNNNINNTQMIMSEDYLTES